MSVPHAAGAIYSTLDDLLAWHARCRRKAFQLGLGRADVRGPRPRLRPRLGIQTQFGRRQFVHAGGINGFSVVVALYPDDDLFIAVLANIQAAPVQKIASDLAALYFDVG